MHSTGPWSWWWILGQLPHQKCILQHDPTGSWCNAILIRHRLACEWNAHITLWRFGRYSNHSCPDHFSPHWCWCLHPIHHQKSMGRKWCCPACPWRTTRRPLPHPQANLDPTKGSYKHSSYLAHQSVNSCIAPRPGSFQISPPHHLTVTAGLLKKKSICVRASTIGNVFYTVADK